VNVLEIMRIGPVIPVIVVEKIEHAVPLARALVAGGVRVLELTLRTPVALQAIEAIAREVEGAIVGVGTITRAEDFDRSLKAGAVFGVSRGRHPPSPDGQSQRVAIASGVMTPSDVIAARAPASTQAEAVSRAAGPVASAC
jgi:2-dehydro-3-deoxyphosphogluconate aldolase/(4S)-4-hydroxy-2-oxoglutarate aldolase